MVKRGIDISKHQGDINLEALKDQIDFVIIRVGYGNGTIDSKFKRNVDLCLQLGIPFGFYWYSYALNVEGAKREAESMLNAIAPYKDSYSYGVWFDMEDADGYKRKHGMPSNQILREMCATFCKTIQDAGYYAGVYASLSWFNNQLAGSELQAYDKWVAQWPTSGGKQRALNVQANERSNYTLWQFTSDGSFAGYNGRLDTNYAYIDYPAIIRGSSTPTPAPQPDTPTKSNEEIAQEIMEGKWGDGDDRKNRLGAAGYDYNAIQTIINTKYYNGGTSTPTQTTYTVVSGDNLSKIASKYGVDWKTIASTNNIAGPKYIIYPGQKLIIPNGTTQTTTVNTTTTYKVQSGDTLSGIGQKYGIDWHKIADVNGISGPKYIIYTGQTLKIPN